MSTFANSVLFLKQCYLEHNDVLKINNMYTRTRDSVFMFLLLTTDKNSGRTEHIYILFKSSYYSSGFLNWNIWIPTKFSDLEYSIFFKNRVIRFRFRFSQKLFLRLCSLFGFYVWYAEIYQRLCRTSSPVSFAVNNTWFIFYFYYSIYGG